MIAFKIEILEKEKKIILEHQIEKIPKEFFPELICMLEDMKMTTLLAYHNKTIVTSQKVKDEKPK